MLLSCWEETLDLLHLERRVAFLCSLLENARSQSSRKNGCWTTAFAPRWTDPHHYRHTGQGGCECRLTHCLERVGADVMHVAFAGSCQSDTRECSPGRT